MEMATFRLQYCLSCENMTETCGLLVLRPLAVSERANETGYIPIWSQVKFIDRDPTGTHVGSKRLSV